jgi:WD40 repeat protein
MAGHRSALIVATSTYEDARLARLDAPAQDARSLELVLGDPNIGGFDILVLEDQPKHTIDQELEGFFDKRAREDVLLLYFSGHGITTAAPQRSYFFAARNTRTDRLQSTAVAAGYVNELMRHSRARQKVLLVDCCHGGAFKWDMVKAGASAGIIESFHGENTPGTGTAVITASQATQFALQGESIKGSPVQSVFTRVLVEGLETGQADVNSDGHVSLDELYDYLREKATTESQVPELNVVGRTGQILIARNPHPTVRAAALPEEVQQDLQSGTWHRRRGAVDALASHLESQNPSLALAARQALARMVDDPDKRVSSLAASALAYVPEVGEIAWRESGQGQDRKERKDQGHELNVGREPAALPSLEDLYDDALAAYWTGNWDRAVSVLQQIVTRSPDFSDAETKLHEARHNQRLTSLYSAARQAEDTKDWVATVAGFTKVMEVESNYLDARERLERAERQREVARLQEEARRLHRAGQWPAAVRVGEELKLLDAEAADPDGIVTSARAEMEAAKRDREVASLYRAALRDINARKWEEALDGLRKISAEDEDYRDTQALISRVRLEIAAVREVKVHKAREEGKTREEARAKRHPRILLVTEAIVIDHGSHLEAIDFSPDGRKLATAGLSTRIWDVQNGRELLKLSHEGEAYSVAFSPDGLWLATGNYGMARIWYAKTGEKRGQLSHERDVGSVAFSPDGRLLATASDLPRIWDVQTGRTVLQLRHGRYSVQSVAFSPDGRLLATGGKDYTARIWDVQTGRELLKVKHDMTVESVAFTPDGRKLASGGLDDTARIWDVQTGRELLKVKRERIGPRGASSPNSVAFSPSGRWLASGSPAWIWDAETGRKVLEVSHGRYSTLSAAFSPDGRWLASTGLDRTVRIWALE